MSCLKLANQWKTGLSIHRQNQLEYTLTFTGIIPGAVYGIQNNANIRQVTDQNASQVIRAANRRGYRS